ncbi:hypothetical protein CAEBREN_07430 [Caenorhabditis brenneri]|uniref:Uncharacterized protein n=1 Tax=Caenorhabditis brenneri TaxID=135651 RepID=G0P3R3_CAEBE|nr:hypothetical protein CAEBREN_07430 [Caenorhabditis brenneri]
MPSLDFLADLSNAQANIEALQQQIRNDKIRIEELTRILAKANEKLAKNQDEYKVALDVIQKQEMQLEDLRKIRDLFEDAGIEGKEKNAPHPVVETGRITHELQLKVDLMNAILQENGDISMEKLRLVIGQLAADLRQDKDTLAGMVGNLPTTCPHSSGTMPNTLRINAQIGQITREICENNWKMEKLSSATEISSMLARNLKLIEQILALNPELVLAAVEEQHEIEQEEKLVKVSIRGPETA